MHQNEDAAHGARPETKAACCGGHGHAGHDHHDRSTHDAASVRRSRLRHDGRTPRPASTASTIAARPIISARPAAAPNSPLIPSAYLEKDKQPKAAVPEGTIYTCPMHPEIRQVGPGKLPDLRHGAGARGREPRCAAESRTRRHDAPLLDRPRARSAGGRARNGRPSRRRPWLDRSDAVELDSVRVRHAGGAVGRLAVLRARLAVAGDAQSQHVHADRDRHRGGLCSTA